jgi:hypothetical protein
MVAAKRLKCDIQFVTSEFCELTIKMHWWLEHCGPFLDKAQPATKTPVL